MACVSNSGHNLANDAHYFLFFHVLSANKQISITFAMKKMGALVSLKHMSFCINHLYQFIMRESILNAEEMTDSMHVKITSSPIRIFSTLKFMHVIEKYRTPQKSKWQTTRMKQTRCDKLQPKAVRRVHHHFTSKLKHENK